MSNRGPFDPWSSAWSDDVPTDAAALERWQQGRAWEIAERLLASNPFYSARAELPSGRTDDDFRSLPVTTKTDVVADCDAHPPYGSRTTCPPGAIRHVVETSGTSGVGREVYALDEADEQAIFRAEAVGFWWAGARPGTNVLLTLPVGVTAAGLWYYGGLRLIGANVFSVGAYSTERKVEILRRYGAEIIVGTPSYLARLANACEEAGAAPDALGVRSLVVAGEAYGAAWAQMIQERWGATLHEQYGCTERIMGWACPGGVLRDGELATLHVPAELARWEVVDRDTGRPVGDGEWGEMIVTPLQAGASPLLRFATGDRVRFVAAGSCPCGRPLPGIRAGGVQRYDDMLKLRGVNVWPSAFDDVVLGIDGVVDYRGTVRRADDGTELVELRVECESRGDEVLREVRERVRRRVGLRVGVHLVDPGAISSEVAPGFVKVSRWRDERSLLGADGREARP